MAYLLLLLGVLCLTVYSVPNVREWLSGVLRIEYSPAVDMVVLLVASFTLSMTLGWLGLIVTLLAIFLRNR